jgi:hypothetical protein
MIHLVPYRSVNNLILGDSIDRAIELFGPPRGEENTRSGNLNYSYDDFILVFRKGDRALQECVVPYGVPLNIGDAEFDWSIPAMHRLCEEDGNPLEYYGTVLLFRLGLAMSGVSEGDEGERSVSIFLKEVWSDDVARMKPFIFK